MTEQSTEPANLTQEELARLRHEGNCRFRGGDAFCTCGADAWEMARRWKAYSIYWQQALLETVGRTEAMLHTVASAQGATADNLRNYASVCHRSIELARAELRLSAAQG